MPSPEPASELGARLGELADLQRAAHLLAWDQHTVMPFAGARRRGELLCTLQRLAHQGLVDPALGTLLDAADGDDAALVRTVRRDHERARRVPAELAGEIAQAGSEGLHTWLHARERDDFATFLPALERNLELARRYAACFPESEHPYDALLDRYETGATTAAVSALIARLCDGLLPLLAQIADRPEPAALHGDFPVAAQREVGLEMAAAIGFDPAAWRLDDAVHPFAAAVDAHDVRITSRFEAHGVSGLFALVHEMGHGLYEHQVDPSLRRTTLDGGVSLGVHESQSRLWENMVGRSRPFWHHWLPRLRERFPVALRDVDLDAFLRAVSVVRPSLIRVDSDEVTYSLHVALRFELEVALVEGTLDARDLPDAWAAGTDRLLGVTVPDATHGVLQDVHWAEGIFGYFPTYAIGTVLAAQLWAAARADLPALDEEIARGEYGALRAWLRERVHRHGRRMSAPELIEQAVGGPLDTAPLLAHLRERYGALYGLDPA